MIAGPANCAAACPVITKIPAPMMAPIPSVTKLRGPSARLRLCSPDSLASFISVSIGFVANKGLPMQLLLSQSTYTLVSHCQFGLEHCSGAARFALQENSALVRCKPGGPAQPQIDRYAKQHDHEARTRRFRLVKQQRKIGRASCREREEKEEGLDGECR